jgi:hypothetical protein
MFDSVVQMQNQHMSTGVQGAVVMIEAALLVWEMESSAIHRPTLCTSPTHIVDTCLYTVVHLCLCLYTYVHTYMFVQISSCIGYYTVIYLILTE